MAAPIVVNVPNLISDDLPCELDALARPVVCTPFLDWVPQPAAAGAPPTVTLGTRHMVRAFAQRCGLGPLPADLLVARNNSMLQLGFNGAGWSRILTELDNSGLGKLRGLVSPFRPDSKSGVVGGRGSLGFALD